MTRFTPPTEPASRALPTRVSKACDRCRRNKSRCDAYRPCSLCARAGIECLSGDNSPANRASKRRRTHAPARDRSQTIEEESAWQSAGPGTPAMAEQQAESTRGPDLYSSRDAATRYSVPGLPDPPAVDAESQRPNIAENEQQEGSTRGLDPYSSRDAESRRPSIGEADSAMGIAKKMYRLGSQPTQERTVSAIPGGGTYGRPTVSRLDRTTRRPIASLLGFRLPPVDVQRKLLEEYFDAVHWFSLVIYEPKFRSKFESLQDGLAYPSQKVFLLLLASVLGMGAWYKSHRCASVVDFPDEDWGAWALSLIQGAGSELTALMDQTSIASVQTCILLGSYYVYHGKPNLSFALLGATIKTAQAIGLHRQPLQMDNASMEERKRVWWTIYTWDRFASVTYGRPLGINDKDCSVTQPADMYELPCFRTTGRTSEDVPICYASYQRELNRLYLAASPIIEIIYGMRTEGPNEQLAGEQYAARIAEFTDRLWTWRRQLPSHLLLDLSSDCDAAQSSTSRAHRLQALALQLTFDNLLIIFHRPLLAQQVSHLVRSQPGAGQTSAESPSLFTFATSPSPFFASHADSPQSSTEQWWDAAVRTAKVTAMPQLAQMATDSHLVAFMAINLFNSAIVMAVLALSDPLSDRAQEVKRTISRIYCLQELLGKKTQLSMQSNVVLKDVVQMLLHREADAILAPFIRTDQAGSDSSSRPPQAGPPASVEDTLRLLMHLPLGKVDGWAGEQQRAAGNKLSRLNESLASVQRAFPPVHDSSLGPAVHDSYGHDQDQDQGSAGRPYLGDGDTWPNAVFSDRQLENEAAYMHEGSPNANATENGLYWFWDTTWNETWPT